MGSSPASAAVCGIAWRKIQMVVRVLINYYAVAAAGLSLIQSPIGGFDNRKRTLPRRAERRNPDADRDPAHRYALFRTALALANLGADSLGDMCRRAYFSFGHYDAEFITRK